MPYLDNSRARNAAPGKTGQLARPARTRDRGAALLGPPHPTDARPRALIAAALSCLEAAVAAWITSHGTQQLTQTLHHAMDSIGCTGRTPEPDPGNR